MIWLVLALIGAGTFFVTGFNLLTDPLCVSADFGGGRVVQVTCRSDEFGTVTGLQAGLISIIIGLAILVLLFWKPLKLFYSQDKLLKIENSDYNFNKVEEVTDISPGSNGVKKCPKCAEDIKAEAIKCRFCGSDLGPRGVEKTTQLVSDYFKKYLNPQYSFQIMSIVVIVLAVAIFGFINISKTRELNALKETGQICVYFKGTTGNSYGCADYPQIKFGICSKYEFMDWRIRTPDYESLTEDWSRSQGRITSACTKTEYPYTYDFDRKLAENIRAGEYEIWGFPKKALTGDESIGDLDFDLVAKVSLKPKS
jgi:hypothetical protein